MAKVIMIQGTMSNAGKSLLAGGLCRVFRQDGYHVAPFKSQNMALNSFVTRDGLEMGRAQVMQAECAGIEPSVDMNPILLKPTSDVGSQVIVNGRVRGNMPAREYFDYKPKLIPDILEAFRRLCREYDIIVIEGAGSPAEINLMENDIVNMGLAELVDAPVLLVGDIDRGGVFAQLYGTVKLLSEDRQRRIGGLIINKFRGDASLLDSGIEMLEEMAGIPVVGTVPYRPLLIDDEDSLSTRLQGTAPGLVNVGVIRFPRISNFTDIAPFEAIPGVGIRYITRPAELEDIDFLILPGSKNTIGDLRWLQGSGLADAIRKMAGAADDGDGADCTDCSAGEGVRDGEIVPDSIASAGDEKDGGRSLAHAEPGSARHASTGIPVMGICGGYQMLGEWIHDPDGVEEGGSIEGLGLLRGETVLRKEKHRQQVTGTVNLGGLIGRSDTLSAVRYAGYEIHMGETSVWEGAVFSRREDGIANGMQQGNVFGTYVHGIFDAGHIAADIAAALARRKGVTLPPAGTATFREMREQEYDKLADLVRSSLDMEAVYGMLREAVTMEPGE